MSSENRHSGRRAVKDGLEPEGLRRSTRERVGQKDFAVSSSMRKSDRSPSRAPPGEGGGGAEKKGVGPSPLRRSDRGKGSAASSESKNSGQSSLTKPRKGKKEKSLTEVSLESEKLTPGSRRLFSGRDYKSLYQNRKLKSDGHGKKKKKREVKLFQEDGDDSGGEPDEVDENSSVGIERTMVDKELVRDKLGGDKVPSSIKSPNTMKKISNIEPEKNENEETQGETSQDSSQEKMHSKRKKSMFEADAECLDSNASKRVCTSNDEGAGSGPRDELDLTGEGISTRNAKLNLELASPSLNKDSEVLEPPTTVGHVEKCSNLLKGPPMSHPSVSEQFKCFTCKLGGTLLCCVGSGCKRSYHISCLDPPLDEVPSGVWYCLTCVKKKLEYGVHSVSEGVESIWDVKEVSVLDVDGMRNEREFFVKYVGLAHIHNRWIPESKLLLDAPALISKFDRNSQVISWKQECTIPHRLLQKRLLMSPKQRDLLDTQHVGTKLDGLCEWLVKWRGLGNDEATWELDNAPIFKLPDAQALIKDYESRRQGNSSTVDKIQVSENCKLDKSTELQSGNQRMPDSSRFREYWVPVQIANLQLEQYCATLISNSAILCAPNKVNSGVSLRDVLVSSRKCCDHPYIVDTSTPERLSKGIPQSEYLNFGINASGKFQFLDRMLLELKKKGLRALVLFQDFGKDSIGGFLDDLLRQRFGVDSFDIIRTGIQRNVKMASMNNFNGDSNRFVFLLETRACHSSIRLSSIDTVIIFGSDLNPMSDMRALQKLTLDPPSKQIPIFRLYVSHTLEEKALSLATKQERNLDSLQNLGWNTSHLLLMWGALRQFQSLDEFHRDTIMDSGANPSLEDAVQETIQIISSNCNGAELRSSSTFSSFQIVGGAYRCESSLPGGLQCQVPDDADPHNFWAKLLEGKQPPWKFISGSTQRNRKKVQYFDKEAGSEEVVKKRRRLVNNSDSPSTESESVSVSTPRFSTPQLREVNESIRTNSTPAPASASPLDDNILELFPIKNFESEELRKLREEQESLHLSMKPGISQLCKILHITGESEDLVREFLGYMMTFHNVSSDSLTMKQAFQLSLIWTVASLLDLKIDHQQSVDLARKHLSFSCRKDEVEFAYSMVGCYKTIFAYRTGKLESVSPHGLSSYAKSDVMNSVHRFQKKYQKKLRQLVQKQEEEKVKIMQRYEDDKAKIQERLKLESLVINACYEENTSMRRDKLRLIEISSAKELEELEKKKNASLKHLESEEQAARETLQEKENCWLAAVNSWVCPELFRKKLGNEPFSLADLLQTKECSLNDGIKKNPTSVHPPSPADQTDNGLTDNVPENEVQLEAQQIVPPTNGVQYLVPRDEPSSGDRDSDTMAENRPVNETQPEAVSSSDVEANGCPSNQFSSDKQLTDAPSITLPNVEVPSSVPESSHPEVEANHTSEANGEIPPAASGGSISLDRLESLNNAVDQNSAPRGLCQTNVTSTPPETELNNVDPLPPSNQAPEDASTINRQSATAVAESPLSQPVDTAESNQCVNEATVSEPASQVGVLLSSDPLSKDNLAGVPLSEETPRREVRVSNQISILPNLLPRTVSSLPSNSIPPGPSSGVNFSGTRTTSLPIAPEFNNHSAPQVPAWVPPLPHADPLQKELDRLCNEFEAICKSHEETKVKLKSDLEKEIEEINRKYALKQQEIDLNFLTTKNIYEHRHSTVLLNRILAEAFRTKCMEVRSSTSRSGTAQHDANGSSGHQMPLRHHRHQQPIQLNPSMLLERMHRPGSATANRIAPPRPTTAALPSSVSPAIPTAVPTRNTPLPPPLPLPPVIPGVRPTTTVAASPTPPLVSSISYSSASPQGGGTQISSRPPHLRSSSPLQRGGSGSGGIPPRPPNFASPVSTVPLAVSRASPPQRPDHAGLVHHETSRDLPNIANLASIAEARRNHLPQAQSATTSLHLASDFLSGTNRFRGSSSVPPATATAATATATATAADVVCLSDDD